MSAEEMNLSVNGQSQVPPGFRFHPTEEELLHYYLRKKVAYKKIDLNVIRDVDLNKLEPWDIQEKCRIGSTPQNDWYFFSHKDKKYPTGTRTNRATASGFWKATGRDKAISSSFKRIGMRKTLVFYKGRAPHGQKSDWIMHEYRLDDNNDSTRDSSASNLGGESIAEDGWVVCRIFKKKNYHKALESPQSSSCSMDSRTLKNVNSSNNKDGVIDQILTYIGRSCKQENESLNIINQFIDNTSIGRDGNGIIDRHNHASCMFLHLPRLESPTIPSLPNLVGSIPLSQSVHDMYVGTDHDLQSDSCTDQRNMAAGTDHEDEGGLNDWVALDRLVASQLNGQVETTSSKQQHQHNCNFESNQEFMFPIDHSIQSPTSVSIRPNQPSQLIYTNEMDLWSTFTSSSSSDPLCHLSV